MSFLEDELHERQGSSENASKNEPVHPWVLEEFDVSSSQDDSMEEEFSVSTLPQEEESSDLEQRQTLRADIVRLERDLANTVSTAFPLGGKINKSEYSADHGRVLSATELEFVRDDLAEQLRWARAEVSVRAEAQEQSRQLLEQMMLEPGQHRSARISQKELGEHGCGIYHVKPRLGMIGRLSGWWHVKLSSGCPLAMGRGLAPRPA